MPRDDSPDGALRRVGPVCHKIYKALLEGIKTAVCLHEIAGWDHRVDKHLYHHMIRRRAIESLNSLQPDDEPQHHDGDDEWLPMSGLILEEPEDVIRVWHINRADIPRPSTPKKRDFIHQPAVSSRQGELFDATEFLPAAHRDRKNHLILHWTVREHSITRFDLVRPIGTSENQVNIDWRVSLLPQYTG